VTTGLLEGLAFTESESGAESQQDTDAKDRLLKEKDKEIEDLKAKVAGNKDVRILFLLFPLVHSLTLACL